ncbi:MAG: hypothetical protein H7Y16_02865 [Candidatus Parcubacteria bacterium]|nr:hypothetical protein [Burkholderiales bacterium]
MRVRVRKRSAAITLVLAGSAGLGGCGSPVEQRDAYASRQDCVKDWSDTSLCEPAKDGRYASSYHYGPPYYASSGWSFFGRDRIRSSPNAMEATRLAPGSVARSPVAARASRMGISGGGSSSISRGGFGSSSHSSFGS